MRLFGSIMKSTTPKLTKVQKDPRRVQGGLKAQRSMVTKMGEDEAHKWRQEIGRVGGQKSRGGGFTGNPKLASEMSKKGWAKKGVK